MADQVHIRYTKWDGSLHWHFDAMVHARDEHGTWVVVPPGSRYRKGADPERIDEHGFVVLVPDGEWWTAYFNAVPRGEHGHLIYVDVNTPARWEADTVHLVDLDLDVILDLSGSPRVVDEDEFDEHRERWAYPDHVVDRARTTAARVVTTIASRTEPFGTAGDRRLAEALGWAHGTVVAGHGVASGVSEDPRHPQGTLADQLPHFATAGLPIDGLHPGTINVRLEVLLRPARPRLTIERLTWHPAVPPETFSFFDARIAVDGQLHHAFVYRPHPETKPDHHQPDDVVEILAGPIEGLEPGASISVWVDPTQAGFAVA